MAIGWLTVLKMVPWGDVIENAPKVAQGAKKLWSTVGKKPVPGVAGASPQGVPGQGTLGGQDAALAALQAQVTELQVATAELHQHMVQSSTLIQSLADQNTQLIARVEVNRKRVLLLAVVTTLLTLVLALQYFR